MPFVTDDNKKSEPEMPFSPPEGTAGPSAPPLPPPSYEVTSPLSEHQPLISPREGGPMDDTLPPSYPTDHSAGSMSSRDFFASLEYKRTAKGYTSSDAWLNTDPSALQRFISECNERPRVSVEIMGSHQEDHIVHSTHTDNDGRTHQETHSRTDTVVDFKFTIELTSFVHERGTIYTARDPITQEPMELSRVLGEYVKSDNLLKELRVQKKVLWDYELVRKELTEYIKLRGYPHMVSVSFPMENDAIVVKSHYMVARVWRHPVTSFLCFITCACLVGWPLQYLATHGWKNKVMSDFVVVVSPRDFVQRHGAFIDGQVNWS